MIKKILVLLTALFVVGVCSAFGLYYYIAQSLPQIISVNDYKPLLVTQVFDRNNHKIGEFFRERRTLVPYQRFPKKLIETFLAAEDDQFFQHKGLNYMAILRSALANLRAARSAQGGSTITQQLARTLFLTQEKTLVRKAREILLALEMEKNLSKEEILYLYLNQIYFGEGAYGVEAASEVYFNKPVEKLDVHEMAILASLPKAPGRFSPLVNPARVKERQIYVLNRMAEVGFLKKEEALTYTKKPIVIQYRKEFEHPASHYFLETVRQLLVKQLGETAVLDSGLRVFTSLDIRRQIKGQEALQSGLRELDKRQGFRGAIRNITNPQEVSNFLLKERNRQLNEGNMTRVIQEDGSFNDPGPLNLKRTFTKDNKPIAIPPYFKIGQIVNGVVTQIDDNLGLTYVRTGEAMGLIDISTMTWARKPNPDIKFVGEMIKKPSQALKVGDVIEVQIASEKFESDRLKAALSPKTKIKPLPSNLPNFDHYLSLRLEQTPLVEGSLLSLDQNNQDVLALLGGKEFIRNKNEFNRVLQAGRQTGSSFKAIVYAAALDRGYTPATPIMDAPIVFDETNEDSEGQEEQKTWKPTNHSKTFGGDILFRNALIHSLNVPTVRIIEDIGIPWSTEYARRLGIFSPLNPDFTMALGSSGVTLYEMTKVFSQFGRLGKRIHPIIIHKVEDQYGKKISDSISLDTRFEQEMKEYDTKFENERKTYLEEAKSQPAPTPTPLEQANKKNKNEKPPFYFEDSDQLIKPTTAFIMTSLLRGVIEEKGGTGGAARALGREVAGKTGTTNGYYDAWFIGYTPQIATGVWVGFDEEKTLGKGEVGGRAALPIWLDYMKYAHENLPQMTFPVPPGIVFVTIDSETGKLASASTKKVVRQAFLEGTEPTHAGPSQSEEQTDFYKQDLNE